MNMMSSARSIFITSITLVVTWNNFPEHLTSVWHLQQLILSLLHWMFKCQKGYYGLCKWKHTAKTCWVLAFRQEWRDCGTLWRMVPASNFFFAHWQDHLDAVLVLSFKYVWVAVLCTAPGHFTLVIGVCPCSLTPTNQQVTTYLTAMPSAPSCYSCNFIELYVVSKLLATFVSIKQISYKPSGDGCHGILIGICLTNTSGSPSDITVHIWTVIAGTSRGWEDKMSYIKGCIFFPPIELGGTAKSHQIPKMSAVSAQSLYGTCAYMDSYLIRAFTGVSSTGSMYSTVYPIHRCSLPLAVYVRTFDVYVQKKA